MLQQLRAALHPVPKLTSRSAFVAISERSGISLRGSSSSSNITSAMLSQHYASSFKY